MTSGLVVEERKRVKVKKKVLVKKHKGEKSSDPIKKDILGEDLNSKLHFYNSNNSLAESARISVRQNLLEKRNQLEKDLLAENENVADKENQPVLKNLPENKSVRRAFGGVKIVITEPTPNPQRDESVLTNKENTDILQKTNEDERENITDEKKEPNNKNNVKKTEQKDIVGGFGKKKAIKDVTIKNRHQVVSKILLGNPTTRIQLLVPSVTKKSCANKGTDQAAKEKQTSKILLPLLSTWKKGTNHKWGGRGVNIGSNISFHHFIISSVRIRRQNRKRDLFVLKFQKNSKLKIPLNWKADNNLK